jgi:predicted adenine nucleotide alpha hydrolase (AANH) superfamily ATPase
MKEGFETVAYFYNPNIFPLEEYNKRKEAVEAFSKIVDTEVIYPEYSPNEFFSVVSIEAPKPERCLSCWSLRLKKTAKEAKEKGFNSFSTTLLVSPHQDHEAIKQIGSEISQEAGIDFYYADFRPGYRKALDEAKARGLYCQKFCGCIASAKD